MTNKPDDFKRGLVQALAEFQEGRAPALEARVSMLEAGLRELYAATESGNATELKDAMDLARGLLMECEDADVANN